MKAILGATGLLICAALTPSVAKADDAKETIRKDIDTYTQSIDAADPEMGAKVWATTPDVSFIHPLGQERGWDQIKANFYGKIMGGMLKNRHLELASEFEIHVFGSSAVVTFNWDFTAAFSMNDKPVHTTGRETQVYENLPALGWRIVHIHYSPPPATDVERGL